MSASKSLRSGVIVSAHSFLWLRIGMLGGSNCQKQSVVTNSSIGTLVHTGAEQKLSVTLILTDIQQLGFLKLMAFMLIEIEISWCPA